jgi:hypothetical protein
MNADISVHKKYVLKYIQDNKEQIAFICANTDDEAKSIIPKIIDDIGKQIQIVSLVNEKNNNIL